MNKNKILLGPILFSQNCDKSPALLIRHFYPQKLIVGKETETICIGSNNLYLLENKPVYVLSLIHI